jgi:hypothetical protein
VDEEEYWRLLCFSINRLPNKTLRQLAVTGWCDWFEPKRYVLDGASPRITGRVGFVAGRHAWEKRFILLLCPFGSSSEVEWDKLLPPEDAESWLWSEEAGQVILIDPCGSGRVAAPS